MIWPRKKMFCQIISHTPNYQIPKMQISSSNCQCTRGGTYYVQEIRNPANLYQRRIRAKKSGEDNYSKKKILPRRFEDAREASFSWGARFLPANIPPKNGIIDTQLTSRRFSMSGA